MDDDGDDDHVVDNPVTLDPSEIETIPHSPPLSTFIKPRSIERSFSLLIPTAEAQQPHFDFRRSSLYPFSAGKQEALTTEPQVLSSYDVCLNDTE